MSKAWAGGRGEYPELINRLPKLVASTTLTGPLDWNATVLRGARLFPDGVTPTSLQLTRVKALRTGVVMLTFENGR